MACDPTGSRPPSHEAASDADLVKPAELEQSHSLPDAPADVVDSHSPPESLTTAAEDGIAVEQHVPRRQSPLSVQSAPAKTLEPLRPHPDEKSITDSLLRTVSESPRTMKSPRILRHASLPTTYYNRSSMTFKDSGGRPPMASETQPGQLAKLAVDQLQGKVSNLSGFNFRDISGTAPLGIMEGMVYRSSQVFRKEDMDALNVKSALDLREEPNACRKAAEHNVITGMAIAPIQWLPDRMKLHAHRSLPMSCSLCSTEDNKLYHKKLNVFHVDLLPPRMKLQIFVDMPWRIRLKTCLAPLAGKSPQEVMTPAVADPTYLGYAKLYRMMLDLSMRPIARALRVFAHAENLPIIIHCIHGKDRTGLIIALLLLLLGVDEPTVVLDYAKSELELKGGRDRGAVKGVLEDYLVTDEVVASTAQTMEDTLRFLDTRYGGIKRYLQLIGITRSEVRAIRRNLLCDGDGGSLRHAGVTFDEDEDDDDDGRMPSVIKPVKEHMHHLFRPNRDDPGPHHFKHHHAKHAAERKVAEARQQEQSQKEAKRQREKEAEEWAEAATM